MVSNVICIIPARSGSKSVADKNIAPLGGFPIMAYSIAAAKLCQQVDRVMISTDSRRYADIAQKFGAEVPFLRPENLSTDTSTDRDFLLHAMQWLQTNEGHCPEYWLHLRPTTPLRESHLLGLAIEQIQMNEQATSLRSGHKSPESPLKWFTRDSDGCFRGLGDDDGRERYNLPKEHFPQVYIPDGYVDVVKASHILNHPTIHGDSMMGFVSPVCTEVDSPQELDYIRYQLEVNGSELLDYLQQHFSELKGCY
ncbi:acylneuraminate cytidylyltransferase family protein [Bowmanella denitrificans]|uniref:Acylneuraminate cytidylyltransferase family protein n=1 Tax=Bowmanella denitrificans TaxID=366582 RepID=A0ABP3HEY1_9ALTE